MGAGPVAAARSDADLLRLYARARAGERPVESASAYAALLAASPGSPVLAERTMRQAVAAGDRAMAVDAARLLARAGPAGVDARMLLFAEALRTRDWAGADRIAGSIATEPVFGLLAPILRAWQAHERGDRRAAALLAADRVEPAIRTYAAEHRAYLLLASGSPAGQAGEAEALAGASAQKAPRIRVTLAAGLAARGPREPALALLEGEEPQILGARRLLEAGAPLPGAVTDAQLGLATLLSRVASDIAGQEAPEVALVYARLAALLAPQDGAIRMLAAQLLSVRGEDRAAVAALEAIAPASPYAAVGRDSRVRVLAAADRNSEALEVAAADARPGAGPADWARYGDLLMEAEKYDEAAAAYARSVSATREPGAPPEWLLQLLHGSALDRAGRWREAKPALERAHALAPGEATVLNYLGYAQLEKRENIAAAQALIEEASRLEPDDAAITDSLGWSYFLRGDAARAIPLLERAASASAQDPAIHEHLGDAYYSVGRRHEARFAWTAALVGIDDKAGGRVRAKIERGLTPDLAAP